MLDFISFYIIKIMKKIIIKAVVQFHGIAVSYKLLELHSFGIKCQEKLMIEIQSSN